MREVPEWVGSSDDAAIPPRVRLRVFEEWGGRCYLSGIQIRPGDKWELEHKLALCNGGEHRESNLAPTLVDKHKDKTRDDLRIKAKGYRIRKRHTGIKTAKRVIPGSKASPWKKKLSGEVIRRGQ